MTPKEMARILNELPDGEDSKAAVMMVMQVGNYRVFVGTDNLGSDKIALPNWPRAAYEGMADALGIKMPEDANPTVQ